MLKKIKALNPHLEVKAISDPSFFNFGHIVDGYDFSECIHLMDTKEIPSSGNTYVASDTDLMQSSLAQELSSGFYGNIPIQIGYCNGNSCKLNALEYHKCSEIDVAVTDLVLLLADRRNIINNQIASSAVTAFYVPAGVACELYGTTLHFAPCKLYDEGYKSIIVLSEGTNNPLISFPPIHSNEDSLLWMQNKWLIAHEDSLPASKGACIGITGKNIEIYYK